MTAWNGLRKGRTKFLQCEDKTRVNQKYYFRKKGMTLICFSCFLFTVSIHSFQSYKSTCPWLDQLFFSTRTVSWLLKAHPLWGAEQCLRCSPSPTSLWTSLISLQQEQSLSSQAGRFLFCSEIVVIVFPPIHEVFQNKNSNNPTTTWNVTGGVTKTRDLLSVWASAQLCTYFQQDLWTQAVLTFSFGESMTRYHATLVWTGNYHLLWKALFPS